MLGVVGVLPVTGDSAEDDAGARMSFSMSAAAGPLPPEPWDQWNQSMVQCLPGDPWQGHPADCLLVWLTPQHDATFSPRGSGGSGHLAWLLGRRQVQLPW